MLEMFKGMINSPETTITNDISESDTLIYVLDETSVPEELPNLMVLGTGTSAETVKVLEVNGNALTVERGFQGVARSWNAGTVIARNFTEYDYNALMENIKTLKTKTDTNADDLAAHKADIMPHATTNDITLYVSVSGDDGTGDGSQEKPFASLQKAVDTLPLVINHKVTINILTGEHDYTTATIIEGIIANINSRIGSGMLIIDGGDKDTTIFKLPEQSPLPFSFMDIKNNNILIQLQNITFEKVGAVNVTYKWGLRIENSNVYINNCKFINIGRAGNYTFPTIGYHNGSAGFVENCTFENCGNCIAVGYWGDLQPSTYHLPSDIVSKNNTGTPVYGYGLVAIGGTIRKVDTQPTGGNWFGDELLGNGGQII